MQAVDQYIKITDIFIILCTSTLTAFLVSGIPLAGLAGFELLLLVILRFILVLFEAPLVFARLGRLLRLKNGNNTTQQTNY